MPFPPVPHRTVLVTGCSSGIGAATARWLRDRGWRVHPTARKPADLDALRAEGYDPVALDLADAASVAAAAELVLERTGGRIGALVNNAGYAQAGALEDVSRDALRLQFEVNVFGAHDLTRRLIPAFRAQGAGRIVNVSSIFRLITSPMLGSYCATKHALESLSDALRMELRGDGIAVSLVEPGPIVTAFRRNAAAAAEASLDPEASRFGDSYRREIERRKNRVRPAAPDLFRRPPESVARRIAHALESPRPHRRYVVTLPARFGALMRRIAPAALLDHLMRKRVPR